MLLLWRGRQAAAKPKSAGVETLTGDRATTTMVHRYRHPAIHFLGRVAEEAVEFVLALILVLAFVAFFYLCCLPWMGVN
jgi:hypothetical protein